jgi:hypothetical protein
MAYYKLDLELMEGIDRALLLESLSTNLNLPVEPTQIWRSNRTQPFLQMIDTDIYIRHIRDLSGMQRDNLIQSANDLVGIEYELDLHEPMFTATINKPGSLTFKFFH